MSSIFQEFVAGWWGGVAGLLVGHPFDTVKSRLQTQGVGGRAIRYHGTVHCFADIIKTEGVRGLYKGMASPLIGMAAINATIFGVYGISMRHLEERKLFPFLTNSALSGASAGIVQSFICSPLELIKLRMQMQGIGEEHALLKKKGGGRTVVQYRGPLRTVLHIINTDGPLGLSKGFVVTFWRETPAFALYFYTYDYLCLKLARGQPVTDLGPMALCLAGGVSGINAWLVTYPFDVIKSRIQVDGVNSPLQYSGMMDCFYKSYRAEGWRVFFRGLNSTLVRAFPTNAATFSTVTYILRFWRRE